MPSFNCYSDQSSPDEALLRPWPKCGITSLPSSISGKVTYSGTAPSICPFADGTYSVTWSQLNVCSTTYITNEHPIAIDINLPGFMPGEHDTGTNLFGFITNYATTASNSGSCTWDGTQWVFTAGWSGWLMFGGETCYMTVEITGVG